MNFFSVSLSLVFRLSFQATYEFLVFFSRSLNDCAARDGLHSHNIKIYLHKNIVDGASYVIHSIASAVCAGVCVAVARRNHCLFIESIKPYYLIRAYVQTPPSYGCSYICIHIWIYMAAWPNRKCATHTHTSTHPLTRDNIISAV